MSSLPPLSNFQIEKGNEHNPSFGGCFSRDNLPLHLDSKYYIVNLDSQSGPGTHWCLLDNRRPHECIYCDSFGFPPPQEVAEKMQATGKHNLVYNDVDVQALGSEACGWWAEYFADKLGEGHDFRQVVGFAEKQPDPDAYLREVYEAPKKGEPFQFKKRSFLQHQLEEGTGIFSFVKNRIHFKPRQHATKRFKNFLDKNGQQAITKIEVGRQPVVGAVQKVLNVLSLGQYEKQKKKLNYDNVYHNYLVITLQIGYKYRIERNHVIEATPVKSVPSHKYDELLYDVPIHSEVKLNSLVANAEKGNNKFWQYDPVDNNCQRFVNDMIYKNHLEPTDPEVMKVLQPQDGKKLLSTLPSPLQAVPRTITDIAAVGDRVIHGDGLEGPPLKRSRKQ
jgi:hypothetical protein